MEPQADATMRASRALLGHVARSLQGALEHVTLGQYRVLVVLASRGPQRMGELAEAVGVHPSTLTRTVERLVAGGYVSREIAEASRREVIIGLDEAGTALVEDVMRRRRDTVTATLERLTDDERAAVLTGMELYAQAADEPAAADLLTLGM
ncbi:MarR family winged helix-turn-helix transcriptional regulator [Demequina sp. NBRC 110057]|uniref:MarR family winged helix-turn-helix transcriptional regulator n=1 Tax=Demequina sp. NBRC 110057 TaxID=1570346 RepID=UPI0013565026|nr:MarR family transcriptional regulator [Demequina sp. NBRC 110057]